MSPAIAEIETRRAAAGVSKVALARRAGVRAATYHEALGGSDAKLSTATKLSTALEALIAEKEDRNG